MSSSGAVWPAAASPSVWGVGMVQQGTEYTTAEEYSAQWAALHLHTDLILITTTGAQRWSWSTVLGHYMMK